MRCYRIKITSWISSFRYPNLISGYQPTLQVPPISTVLGVINACAGRYLDHKLLPLGYYFEYSARSIDLETIYQIGLEKEIKQNVIKRQSKGLESYFKTPSLFILSLTLKTHPAVPLDHLS